MNVLKYFAVPALALSLLASCTKNEQPKQDGPKDLVVSLTLGGGVRAAMNTAVDKIADQGAATVTAVDMYLVDGANKVVESKRFSGADLTQLMKGTALGKNDDNGWKFNDVSSSVIKVITVVNPQGALIAKDQTLNLAVLELKAAAGEAVYYDAAALATATEVENFGHNPNSTGRKVIAMNITAKGLMNRFQVEDIDFVAIKFKSEAVKAEYQAAINAFVAKKVAGGMTKEDAIKAFATDPKGMNGSTYKNPSATVGFGDKTKKWSDFFKVVNVSNDTKSLFMNRFNFNYTLDTEVNKLGMMSLPQEISKAADGYTVADGTLKFSTKDRSAIASYYVAGGLPTVLTVNAADPSKNKVAAFNFFANDDNNTKLNYAKTAGTAPTLHFYISGTNVSDAARYINIKGYVSETNAALDNTKLAKGAQLLTINVRNAAKPGTGDNVDGDGDGKPDGPIADSDDPTEPGVGGNDVTDDGKKNLAVHVVVTPWTNNNVKPVF